MEGEPVKVWEFIDHLLVTFMLQHVELLGGAMHNYF